MMPIPKDYLLREGDVVVLHGVVRYDFHADDPYVHVQIEAGHVNCGVKLNEIQGIHAMKWSVGDKVFRSDGGGGSMLDKSRRSQRRLQR